MNVFIFQCGYCLDLSRLKELKPVLKGSNQRSLPPKFRGDAIQRNFAAGLIESGDFKRQATVS